MAAVGTTSSPILLHACIYMYCIYWSLHSVNSSGGNIPNTRTTCTRALLHDLPGLQRARSFNLESVESHSMNPFMTVRLMLNPILNGFNPYPLNPRLNPSSLDQTVGWCTTTNGSQPRHAIDMVYKEARVLSGYSVAHSYTTCAFYRSNNHLVFNRLK